MSKTIRFMVPGKAATKGSNVAIPKTGGGTFFRPSDKRLKSWSALVATLAMQAGCKAVDASITIEAVCAFRRPKAHFRASGKALRWSAPERHTQKPDVDKVARALLDALTGVAFVDDSRVHDLRIMKRWAPFTSNVDLTEITLTVED